MSTKPTIGPYSAPVQSSLYPDVSDCSVTRPWRWGHYDPL